MTQEFSEKNVIMSGAGLPSERASFITGIDLVVDGGLMAQL